jgi:hypothetical protein
MTALVFRNRAYEVPRRIDALGERWVSPRCGGKGWVKAPLSLEPSRSASPLRRGAHCLLVGAVTTTAPLATGPRPASANLR